MLFRWNARLTFITSTSSSSTRRMWRARSFIPGMHSGKVEPGKAVSRRPRGSIDEPGRRVAELARGRVGVVLVAIAGGRAKCGRVDDDRVLHVFERPGRQAREPKAAEQQAKQRLRDRHLTAPAQLD